MGKELYTAEQFITAISGSGGIVSTIAKRVGCEWNTAHKYINTHPTVRAAYAAECESILDMCESVVFRNVQLAQAEQAGGRVGDTSDAKWVLARKGKDRGWNERSEVSGPNNGPIRTETKVDHAHDGDTAATIFDILAAVGALSAAPDDAETE